MLVSEIIDAIKTWCGNSMALEGGRPIDEEKTRDKVLWGDPEQECTGIVTCIWATSDVIRHAQEIGANLIIPHEALFWNHGDHTDWLSDNTVFQAKRDLLDAGGTVVWRWHDYIHAGLPAEDGSYVDGIFRGLARKLGWDGAASHSPVSPLVMELPETTAGDLATDVVARLGLAGTRIVGDPQAPVRKVAVVVHMFGFLDNQMISFIEGEDIDCILTMETTDYTVLQYLRDSCQQGRPRAAITIGHFNIEEPGMAYAAGRLREVLGDDLTITFMATGDPFSYVGT